MIDTIRGASPSGDAQARPRLGLASDPRPGIVPGPIAAKPSRVPGAIETARVRACPPDYELLIYVHRPASRQVEAVLRGQPEFALIVEEPAILIPFRFGDAFPWTVACYDRPGSPRDRGAASPSEARAHLDVLLIDAEQEAVRATRAIPLWLDFSLQLEAAIREQAHFGHDPAEWRRAVSRITRRFPTPETLVAHSLARTQG